MLLHRCQLMVYAWVAVTATTCSALVSPEPLSFLLQKNAASISNLKSIASELGINLHQLPYNNDVFFLRFSLLNTGEDPAVALQQSLDWRKSAAGVSICEAATTAITKAMSSDTTTTNWNNAVVFQAAPHAKAIGRFITPSNCITTTASTGDLVYCIRAGGIDDLGLMKAVSVEQMVDFFLYTKEVNALVSDIRSVNSNKLLNVVTCNDLSGVKLLGGSADFRKALSSSSTIASRVYPNTAGPTLLLNLPALLSALVKLFTPLFPEKVKERLKFQQGPLRNVQNLLDVSSSSSSPARTEFVRQLDELLYKTN